MARIRKVMRCEDCNRVLDDSVSRRRRRGPVCWRRRHPTKPKQRTAPAAPVTAPVVLPDQLDLFEELGLEGALA